MTAGVREDCPKRMEYGPCGGVEHDGRCEVAAHPCVFLDSPTVRWRPAAGAPPAGRSTGDTPAGDRPSGATEMRALLAGGRVVVADLPARALDASSIAGTGALLAGRVDAVLAGDAPNSRVQFPPAYRALLVGATGLRVWAGMTCRDRNRVAMEGELAALAEVGVAGVHCVTGDHPRTGSRPDATPVFDLDSTRAAALARSFGHLVSVAESPASPPVDRRPARLLEKVRAGAEVCFVNHAGGAAPVAKFIASVRTLQQEHGTAPEARSAATLVYVPCVPLVIDTESARLLRSFRSLVLPEGFLDRILAARDPYAEGIAAALDLAGELLALDGVAGVNLSGGAGPGNEIRFAEALATVGEALGARR